VTHFLLLSISLLGYNITLSSLPQHRYGQVYVPANIVVAALLVGWFIHFHSLSPSALGIRFDNLLPSFYWGVTFGLLIGILIFVSVLKISSNFQPASNLSTFANQGSTKFFPILVGIPAGTVLLEEIAFRGVMFALLMTQGFSTNQALILSSLAFGVWHIGLVVRSRKVHSIVSWPGFTCGILMLVVGFIGGIIYGALRIQTGNIVGCLIAHWIANSFSIVAAGRVAKK